MGLARSFVTAIHPRFNDFKFSVTLATLVLLGMVGTFAGVLAVGLQPSTVTNRQSSWTNEMGEWADHKLAINRIHERPAATPEGTERDIDMCIVYADGTEIDVFNVPFPVKRSPCELPPNVVIEAMGFPEFLRWCEWEKVPTEFQKLFNDNKKNLEDEGVDTSKLVDPWDYQHAATSVDYPSYLCKYQDLEGLAGDGKKFIEENCDEDEFQALPAACGQGDDFQWDKYTDTPSGDQRLFRLVIQYTVTETQQIRPSVATILGASLGYLALIHLAASAVFGVIFVGLGIAKPVVETKSPLAHLFTKPDLYEHEKQIKELQAAVEKIQPDALAPEAKPMGSGVNKVHPQSTD